MATNLPPLIAAARAVQDFDADAAAIETGLNEQPRDEAATALLWLTLVAMRAGCGLPADPLRARGWLRFGEALNDGAEPAPGDVVLVAQKDGEVAGLVIAWDRGWQISIGPDEVIRVPRKAVLAVRRPLIAD